MDSNSIGFKALRPWAKLPVYKKDGDSGMDVCAAHSIAIAPFGKAKVGLGIACEIPEGYELQVRPRSGLSSEGIVAIFGTVDSGYRGEIAVSLFNLTRAEYMVHEGDRIAQLVLAPVSRRTPVWIEELSETERGADGFGSTGRN